MMDLLDTYHSLIEALLRAETPVAAERCEQRLRTWVEQHGAAVQDIISGTLKPPPKPKLPKPPKPPKVEVEKVVRVHPVTRAKQVIELRRERRRALSPHERYIARKASGLCVTCRIEPPRPGHVACEKCAEAQAERMRDRLRENAAARQKNLEAAKARRAALIARGVCIRCADCPPVPGMRMCQACRDGNAKSLVERRRRQKAAPVIECVVSEP